MRMMESRPVRDSAGRCIAACRRPAGQTEGTGLAALGMLLALILLLLPASLRAGTEIPVGSQRELSTALQNAKGGETILLAPGRYSVSLNVPFGNPWGAYAETVTIRSADPGNPAELGYVALREATNLHFDNLVFNHVANQARPDQDLVRETPFLLRDTKNITIRNSVFKGDLLQRGENNIHAGFGIGVGLQIRGSQDITVADSRFEDWMRAMTVSSSSNITVTGNLVEKIRSDGFNFAQVQNVLIENNTLRDFASTPDSWDHRDMIQFWTNGTSRPTTDVVIRGNILDTGSGIHTQSIFMRNEVVDSHGGGLDMYYRNIVIEDNLIHNGHAHGITMGETVGLQIRNNTLLFNADSGGSTTPRINVAGRSRDVVIDSNIAHGTPTQPENARNWTLSNNLIVQHNDPLKPNHYDEFFLNARAGSLARIEDFVVRPDSIADLRRIGASITRFDPTPETLTARLLAASVRGIYGGFAFDGGLSADAAGLLDDDRARFIWDFGDGTVVKGRAVDHVFTKYGNNIVTLTVARPDGSTDVVQTRVNVPNPQRMMLQATAGGVVDTRYSTPRSRLQDATVVQDGERFGVQLTRNDGLSMDRGSMRGVFGVEQFGLDLTLKADNGRASAGEIFRVHGNMRLRVNDNGSLIFDLHTADGEHLVMRTGPTSLLNGDWNALRIVYDGTTGRIVGYVNGERIGSFSAGAPTGLTGPERSWGLSLGQLTSSSQGFSGLIGSLGFNALPAELVARTPEPDKSEGSTGGSDDTGSLPGNDTDPDAPGDGAGPGAPDAPGPVDDDQAEAPPAPGPTLLTCADLGLADPLCAPMQDIADIVLPMIGTVDLTDAAAGLVPGPLFADLPPGNLQWGIDPENGALWWAYAPLAGDPDLVAFLLGGEGFDLLIDAAAATQIPMGDRFGHYWTSAGLALLSGPITRLTLFAAPTDAPAPIPLPAAGWLLLGGLGLLGLARRRRG